MDWSWLSFFIGILVGWVLEWLIDFLFWRRKYARVAEAEAQTRADLANLQDRVDRVDALDLDLTSSKAEIDSLHIDLSSAQEEIARLQAALAASTAAAQVAGDDLTMIEGIGPKISDLLNGAGIRTFDELGNTEVDRLREILAAGGPGFQIADPARWPRQARLAAKQDWVALQSLKQQLAGGVRRAPPPKPVEPDDLTMIEGIGPKISDLLNGAGIRTFDELGNTEVDRLREILAAGGSAFQMADPASWPRQARLAAKQDWVGLQNLKQQLAGGVRRPVAEEPRPDDDLTQIEGIGARIDTLLKEQGIRTFAQLSKTDPDRLQALLREAGPAFQMSSPKSWPEQARLAEDHAWEELRALQEQLKAGREDA
jgi:predicted flap endonuclease-1-like 5' DNA nuclease